jgi:hypothetical protein
MKPDNLTSLAREQIRIPVPAEKNRAAEDSFFARADGAPALSLVGKHPT